MVEATTVPRAVEPPSLSSRKSSRAIIWILGGIALLAAGLLLFLRMRQPAEPHPQIVATASPVPSSSAAAAMTPMVAQSTISPSIPSPSPAASLGEPAGLTREALAEAEKFEAAHDWPRAVMAYVKMTKNFPQSEVGRVRLELLLSKLQSEKGALRDENFDALREPLTEAAKLDVVSAMEILGDALRKRDPKESFAWLCTAAARGRAHAMAEIGLRYSNGAGVERDFVKASAFALSGAVLTYFGFMHGEAVGIGGGLGVTPAVALAYAVVAAGFFAVGKYGASTASISHPEMPLAAPAE